MFFKDDKYDLKLLKVKNQCLQETGIETSALFKIWLINEDPGSPLKCTYACIFLKMNTMTPDGFFVEEGLKKLIARHIHNEDQKERIFNECKDVQDTDLCKSAFLLVKCIFSHAYY